jgi:hypothetical protein
MNNKILFIMSSKKSEKRKASLIKFEPINIFKTEKVEDEIKEEVKEEKVEEEEESSSEPEISSDEEEEEEDEIKDDIIIQLCNIAKYSYSIPEDDPINFDTMHQIYANPVDIIKFIDQKIALSKLNRLIDEKRIRKLVNEWNPVLDCTFTILYRIDKEYSLEIANGQHRYKALLEMSKSKNSKIKSKFMKTQIKLHIIKCSSDEQARILINSSNDENPIDAGSILQYRYDEIKDHITKNFNYIKSGIFKNNRPYIRNKKFRDILTKTAIYHNKKYSAKDIADKIILLNNLMYKYSKDYLYYKDHDVGDKTIERANKMKFYLGLTKTYEYLSYLDLHENIYDEKLQKKLKVM